MRLSEAEQKKHPRYKEFMGINYDESKEKDEDDDIIGYDMHNEEILANEREITKVVSVLQVYAEQQQKVCKAPTDKLWAIMNKFKLVLMYVKNGYAFAKINECSDFIVGDCNGLIDDKHNSSTSISGILYALNAVQEIDHKKTFKEKDICLAEYTYCYTYHILQV